MKWRANNRNPRLKPKKNYARILVRTVILVWLIVIFTLLIFVVSLIHFQKNLLKENLYTQGRLIFTSISEITASSLVLEDFSAVVDHCMKVVSLNPCILYVVVTRNDGFSLIHLKDGWSQKTLEEKWHNAERVMPQEGCFEQSEFVNTVVYRISFPFNYSGIDWGWIHIGLSPQKYHWDLQILMKRIVQLAVISVLFGFAASFLFARRLTRPIHRLERFTRKVATGDFSGQISIETGDELENLAESLNWMTQSLQKSQETLVATRDYLGNIIHSMNEMLLVVDSNMVIQNTNGAVRTILGYSEEELLGTPLAEIFVGDGLNLKEMSSHDREPTFQNKEASFRTCQGQFIPVLVSCSVMNRCETDSPDRVILAMDITERKMLETQLRHAQKMEAIGQLAGGVAHNINNLLTGIIGNQKLASLKATPDVLHYLHNADNAATRASELVKELLAFSRKSDIELHPIQSNLLIQEIYSLIRQTFSQRIEIDVDLQEDLPLILGDEAQLHSVIMNLCINARDAIEKVMKNAWSEFPCDLQYRIVLKTERIGFTQENAKSTPLNRSGDYVVLSVSDNGIGIDDETKKHIFEPFFTTKMNVGNGLGLASSFGIVKQHNGWIDFSSTYRQGTVFRIFLPVYDTIPNEKPVDRSSEIVVGGNETILFADDEQVIRNLAQEILELRGYRVLAAVDGKECFEVYMKNRESIDLIVLDLSMPYLSGIEVMKRILQEDVHAKVIISSGHLQEFDGQSIDQIGAMGIISKPYRPDALLKKVRMVLDHTA